MVYALPKVREGLICRLFAETGKNCWLELPFNCDYGGEKELQMPHKCHDTGTYGAFLPLEL